MSISRSLSMDQEADSEINSEADFEISPEANFEEISQLLGVLPDYSSSLESDSDSSSSSDESWEDDHNFKMLPSLVEVIATRIPFIVAIMMRQTKQRHDGSTFGRRYIYRERKSRHDLIVNDYVKGEDSKYTLEQFRRRF